jgi:PTH2 family peptidyl-tRNA hydrolase
MKQVIVLRKDLNMRKGKMVAQGSHACLYAYLKTSKEIRDAWFGQRQTKICVSVDSEEELFAIYKAATDAGLPAVLIQDAGLTEFKEPTYTAVGIGPCEDDDVNKITGNLKLL